MVLQQRKWKTLALVAIGALLFSGCSSTPATSKESSPSSGGESNKVASVEAGSTPVETAKLPEKPAVMKEHTEEGLNAAVRHWVDLQNYAIASGDTEPLAEFSAPNCDYCNDAIAEIDKTYGTGGRIDGGLYKVAEQWASLDTFEAEDGDEKHVLTTLVLERDAGTAYDSSDKAIREYEAVSCEEAIANWDKVAFDENGNFIGSSCALAVTDVGFEKATGWKPLDLMYNAQ
ncbi:DUF6318 family protein [Glutamicibacter ardleyensis]|uniref:DUF6318 family protein n=1 Tax=Glutamicibacter ardleyensis TaxID=225894 RepID=UPI003F9D85F3